jgi:hypothetical protein
MGVKCVCVCVPVGIGSDVTNELAVDHARGIEAEAHFNAQRALEIAVDGLGHTHHLSSPATKRKVRGVKTLLASSGERCRTLVLRWCDLKYSARRAALVLESSPPFFEYTTQHNTTQHSATLSAGYEHVRGTGEVYR